MSSLSLPNQHVTQITHYSHTGTPSIIGLVLTPRSLSTSTSTLPPLASSDHKVIHASITLPYSHNSYAKQPSRSVWLYHLANLESINESLLSLDWKSLLPSTLMKPGQLSPRSPSFFSIVHRFTPTKTLSHTPLPPWFPCHLLHRIHKCRRLYNTTILSNSQADWNLYILFHKELDNICKQASKILLLKLTFTIPLFLLDLHQVP